MYDETSTEEGTDRSTIGDREAIGVTIHVPYWLADAAREHVQEQYAEREGTKWDPRDGRLSFEDRILDHLHGEIDVRLELPESAVDGATGGACSRP